MSSFPRKVSFGPPARMGKTRRAFRDTGPLLSASHRPGTGRRPPCRRQKERKSGKKALAAVSLPLPDRQGGSHGAVFLQLPEVSRGFADRQGKRAKYDRPILPGERISVIRNGERIGSMEMRPSLAEGGTVRSFGNARDR